MDTQAACGWLRRTGRGCCDRLFKLGLDLSSSEELLDLSDGLGCVLLHESVLHFSQVKACLSARPSNCTHNIWIYNVTFYSYNSVIGEKHLVSPSSPHHTTHSEPIGGSIFPDSCKNKRNSNLGKHYQWLLRYIIRQGLYNSCLLSEHVSRADQRASWFRFFIFKLKRQILLWSYRGTLPQTLTIMWTEK